MEDMILRHAGDHHFMQERSINLGLPFFERSPSSYQRHPPRPRRDKGSTTPRRVPVGAMGEQRSRKALNVRISSAFASRTRWRFPSVSFFSFLSSRVCERVGVCLCVFAIAACFCRTNNLESFANEKEKTVSLSAPGTSVWNLSIFLCNPYA